MMSRLSVGVAALLLSVSASFGADITVGFRHLAERTGRFDRHSL